MEEFTNDGFTFEVTDAGSSSADQTVVLLHGFPESRKSWELVTPHLVKAGYRVLAPNQRGYSPGARPKARSAYTLDKLAGDVLAMADAAGVDRFHVVGHDLGGAVAWALATDHADRLRTLTSLATPHPQAMVKAALTSTQGFKSWYMLFFQLPGLPEIGFGRLQGRMRKQLTSSGLPDAYVDEYLELLGQPGAARGALNWYRALPLSRRGGEPVLVPTMYVYGTGDFALGRTAADLTANYVAGPYRYEILEGVSHWIPEEVPQVVADLVLDHLGVVRQG